MTDLAKLVVKLEAQSAQLTAELTKAKGQLGRFESDVSKIAANVTKGIGLATAASAVGFGLLIKKSLDAADELGNLAQQTGISVEALSQLEYAAKLSDASTEDFQTGLIRLNKAIAEAGTGSGAAADAFRAIGVSVKDQNGNLRSSEAVLTDIADAYAGLDDGAGKTAVTLDIFGRSGANLIPLLDSGADGIAKMRAEADRLGLTISQKTSDAADQFDKNLKALSLTMEGVGRSVAEQLAPKLVDLSNIITNPAFSDGLKKIVDLGISGVEAVARLVQKVGNFSESRELSKLQREAASLRDSIERKQNGAAVLTFFDRDVGAEIDQAKGRLGEIQAQIAAIQSSVKGFSPDLGNVATLQDMFGKGAKRAIQYGQSLAETGSAAKLARDALSQYDLELDLHQKLVQEQEERQKPINDLIQQAAAIYEQTRTPLEQYTAKIRELNELSERFATGLPGGIDPETYARAVLQAQNQLDSISGGIKRLAKNTEDSTDQMTKYAERAAQNMQDAFANFLFDPFKDGLRGLVLNFARAIQQMAAQAAAAKIFESLTGGGGGGGGGGILSAVLGAFGGLGTSGGAISAPPGRAIGGPVDASSLYMVGERGPELFVPNVSGSIVPNHALGGAPPQVNIRNVNAFDTSAIGDYLNTAAGEQVILNVVSRNGSKIRNSIA